MCRVVNRYHEKYDVYIGRGSMFGNPYSHLTGTRAKYLVANRKEAIAKYRGWLWNEIKLRRITPELLRSLDGKLLGCYCYPKACHGDVIVQAVKWAKEQK